MDQDTIVLKVKDVCGPHCVGIEDGTGIFNRILPLLRSGSKICLDFEGVVTITSSFLNASIGKLFGRFESGDLEKRFTWKGLDESDTQLIQLVIRNAREHFAKSQNARQVEDNIVRRALEENQSE
jgi:hypothetical protein